MGKFLSIKRYLPRYIFQVSDMIGPGNKQLLLFHQLRFFFFQPVFQLSDQFLILYCFGSSQSVLSFKVLAFWNSKTLKPKTK
jgi:hypothetical protein